MGITMTPWMDRSVSEIISMRSSKLKRYVLAGLLETATTTSSNNEAARTMISMWPLWTGSNDPGHTARCIVVNVSDIYMCCYILTTLLQETLIPGSSDEIHHGFTVSPRIYDIDTGGPFGLCCLIGSLKHKESVIHER